MTRETMSTTPQNMKTRLRATMPERMAAMPRMMTRTPTVIRPLRITCLEDHGRAVGDDLAHGLADLGGVEAHHDDAVGPHGGGVLDQPVDRLAAGLLEELGVFVDLAAHDGAEAGHDVAAEPA